jgi:hypothetical protein
MDANATLTFREAAALERCVRENGIESLDDTERAQYDEMQRAWARVMSPAVRARLLEAGAKLKAELQRFECTFGVDFDSGILDRLDELPDGVGALTITDVLVQGERGHTNLDDALREAIRYRRPLRQPSRAQVRRLPVIAPVRRARTREHRATPARTGGRTSGQSPGGSDPEPPPRRRLTADERHWLRLLIDRAVRARLAAAPPTRECRRCWREHELDAFSPGCTYCRSCESERVSAHNRRRREELLAA